MGQCKGCSQIFPNLDTEQCQRCSKKSKAPQDSWTSIDAEPQCRGCGVIWIYMKGTHCGACAPDEGALPSISTVPQLPQGPTTLARNILSAAHGHQKNATQTRLSQKANTATARSGASQDHAAKMAALRSVTKGEYITIEVSLYYWPIGGSTIRKVPVHKFAVMQPTSAVATDVLNELLPKAELAFLSIPEERRPLLSFNKLREIDIGVISGNDVRKIDESYLCSTLGRLFSELQNSGAIPDKAARERKLSLRFTTWEKDLGRTRIVKSKTKKRQNVDNGSSDDDYDIVEVRPAIPTRSTSEPPSPIAKRPRMDASSASAIRFQSAFRPEFATQIVNQQLDKAAEDPFPYEYQEFSFRRIDYEVDNEGLMSEVVSDKVETIHVPIDWLSYAKNKDAIPQKGYLAKGLSKYSFKARIGGTVYAVFQAKAGFSYDAANEEDLRAELKVLRRAQYFMNDFHNRVSKSAYAMQVPEITWNANGAFVGELVPRLKICGPAAEESKQNLIFNHFLAASLLPIEEVGHEEIRFLGNLDIENCQHGMKAVINAFLHSALVDSQGQFLFADIQGLLYNSLRAKFPNQALVLFDPQAHTPSGQSGHWDQGRKQIEAFLDKHQCNRYCEIVGLEDISKFDRRQLILPPNIALPTADHNNFDESQVVAAQSKRTRPLRIGFDS